MGPRRVYIRAEVEIKRYGRTPGCPGCEAIAAGTVAKTHSESCRQRIMDEMKKDEELARRVDLAEGR